MWESLDRFIDDPNKIGSFSTDSCDTLVLVVLLVEELLTEEYMTKPSLLASIIAQNPSLSQLLNDLQLWLDLDEVLFFRIRINGLGELKNAEPFASTPLEDKDKDDERQDDMENTSSSLSRSTNSSDEIEIAKETPALIL